MKRRLEVIIDDEHVYHLPAGYIGMCYILYQFHKSQLNLRGSLVCLSFWYFQEELTLIPDPKALRPPAFSLTPATVICQLLIKTH